MAEDTAWIYIYVYEITAMTLSLEKEVWNKNDC